MFSNINFGIPTNLKRRHEKYPDLKVLTMLPKSEVKGSNCKFVFNKKAMLNIGLGSVIGQTVSTYVKEDENQVFLAETTSFDQVSRKDKYQVTRTGSFSNKSFYNFLAKKFNLDKTVDNEFELTEVVDDTVSIKMYKLDLIRSEEEDSV